MTTLTFAPIPNYILRHRDLSHGAKLCCARLIQYAGKTGKAYPKLSTLADELGMSVRAVQRFISELEFNALIETRQRGRGRSNIYILDESLLIHNFIHNTPLLATLDTPEVATPDTPLLAYPYRRRNNFKKKLEEITPESVDNLEIRR